MSVGRAQGWRQASDDSKKFSVSLLLANCCFANCDVALWILMNVTQTRSSYGHKLKVLSLKQFKESTDRLFAWNQNNKFTNRNWDCYVYDSFMLYAEACIKPLQGWNKIHGMSGKINFSKEGTNRKRATILPQMIMRCKNRITVYMAGLFCMKKI